MTLMEIMINHTTNTTTNFLSNIINNDYLILLSLLILIIFTGTVVLELEDQLHFLKKKTKYQDGNIEFLIEKLKMTEIKMNRIMNQQKKIKKEMKEYA